MLQKKFKKKNRKQNTGSMKSRIGKSTENKINSKANLNSLMTEHPINKQFQKENLL